MNYVEITLKLYTMNIIIAKLMFILQLHSGFIVATNDVDGRTIYSIPSAKIEYAYKAEIIRYLETGVFVYDETLDDAVDLTEVTKVQVKL